MSAGRREHQLRTALYDDFQDYIVNNCRDRDNATLCLKAYDMVKQNTDTHLEVVLENVDNATKQLYDHVESFRHGTKMKTREQIKDGAPVFCIHIPLKDKKGSSSSIWSSGSSGSKKKNGPPSQNVLMLYFIAICILVVFASLKTTVVEWRQLGWWN
jgi:hypothetical protein